MLFKPISIDSKESIISSTFIGVFPMYRQMNTTQYDPSNTLYYTNYDEQFALNTALLYPILILSYTNTNTNTNTILY